MELNIACQFFVFRPVLIQEFAIPAQGFFPSMGWLFLLGPRIGLIGRWLHDSFGFPRDWITIAIQSSEVILSGVLAGWLIAKLHRQSPKAMVLVYAACFAGTQILRMVLELITDPFHYYPFAYVIAFIVMLTGGLLFGGSVFNNGRDGIAVR